MSQPTIALVACSLCCACACKARRDDKPASGSPPAESRSASAKVVTTARLESAKPPASAGIEEKAVRALVVEWLAAQNGGDFSRYKALYASRLIGIKRSGPRTRRFDRTGWLADRQRMFRRKMVVAADKLRITAGRQMAVVELRQSWASGRYKDVGPKRLVVVAEAEKLRIAREEMLRSRIEGKSSVPPLPLDRFAFVVKAGAHYLVLSRRVDVDWQKGPPASIDGHSTTRRAVDVAKLDVSLRRWLNRSVELFGADGMACRGRIERIDAVGRVEPHFGTVQGWNGEDGEEAPSPAEIARDAWELAGESGVFLGGRIAVQGKACGKVLWARAAGPQKRPFTAAPTEADAKLRAAALARFRALPAYARIARSYRQEGHRTPAFWDEHEGAKAAVKVYATGKKGTRLVAVEATAGSGCGQFEGQLWSLWEVTGAPDTPKLALATEPSALPAISSSLGILDADGDGVVEIIVELGEGRALLRRNAASWTEVTSAPLVPFLDCPC